MMLGTISLAIPWRSKTSFRNPDGTTSAGALQRLRNPRARAGQKRLGLAAAVIDHRRHPAAARSIPPAPRTGATTSRNWP